MAAVKRVYLEALNSIMQKIPNASNLNRLEAFAT